MVANNTRIDSCNIFLLRCVANVRRVVYRRSADIPLQSILRFQNQRHFALRYRVIYGHFGLVSHWFHPPRFLSAFRLRVHETFAKPERLMRYTSRVHSPLLFPTISMLP